MSRFFYFFIATIATVAVARFANAQPAANLSAARVTLVAGPAPSKGGRTEVIRQANRAPRNIVIVHKNANADDLAAALATLNALRQQDGDKLTTDYRARTERVRWGPKWANSEYRKWLVEQLARLKKAAPVVVGDLGRVQAVDITLPAPRTK